MEYKCMIPFKIKFKDRQHLFIDSVRIRKGVTLGSGIVTESKNKRGF